MERFNYGSSHYIKKTVSYFLMYLLIGVLLITTLDGSVKHSSIAEWISVFITVIGVTVIYVMHVIEVYNQTYLIIGGDKLEVHTSKKSVKTIDYNDIISVQRTLPIFGLRSAKLKVITESETVTVYPKYKEADAIYFALPNRHVDEKKGDEVITLTAKQKAKTLAVWLSNTVLYLSVIYLSVLPVIAGLLKKYSVYYKKSMLALYTVATIIAVGVLLGIIAVYLIKCVTYKDYKIILTKDKIILKYKYLGQKCEFIEKKDVSALYFINTAFSKVFGVKTAKLIIKRSVIDGDKEFFPFTLDEKQAETLLKSLIKDNTEEKSKTSEKKDFVSGYVCLTAYGIAIALLSIFYTVWFLMLVPIGIILLMAYKNGRKYVIGDKVFAFSSGTVWRRECFVMPTSVKAISVGRDYFCRKTDTGTYVLYIDGKCKELTLGVYDNQMLTAIKDKMDIVCQNR